jgi:3-phenylpropionate/trans-cinnamate dioxygenase ferredoxin component
MVEEMEYLKVIEKSELSINQKKIVTIRGIKILIVNHNGNYYAINNKCTHLGGSLGNGELSGTIITCPRHGSKFDIETGKNIDGARMGFLKMKVKDEVVYPIKIEGNNILIGI